MCLWAGRNIIHHSLDHSLCDKYRAGGPHYKVPSPKILADTRHISHTQRSSRFHTAVRTAVRLAVSHFWCSPILLFRLAPRPALVAIKSLDQPLSHATILAVAAVAAVAPVEVGICEGIREGARDGIPTLSTALELGIREGARDGIPTLSTARPFGRDRIRLQQEEVEAKDGAPPGIMPFPIVAQRS